MDKNNKKKIIISIIILTVVFAGVFLGIEKFLNSHEEIKIEVESLPDNSGTYTSITTPEITNDIPKSYFGFIKTNDIEINYSGCTLWDRVSPSYQQMIYNSSATVGGMGVMDEEVNNPQRKFWYNISPSTVITKTYNHGAKYKGKIINFKVTYFDFQPMDASDIAFHSSLGNYIVYVEGAIPSFGLFDENTSDNFPINMAQYSQMIYSFKEKFEFFDDNNNPVQITNGYMSIGGHNSFEWTADIENISNVYVNDTTIMKNTFIYTQQANTSETFNKGITKYNKWLTAGYDNWTGRGNDGYLLYKIADNSSNFTLAIGKDFEAYLTMQTIPSTTTPLDFHTLTINYLEQGTNTVLKAKYGPEGVETGKSYNVSSPETINKDNKTYQIVDINQKNVTGEMPNEDVVINVYYEEVIQKSSYTVNYLDKETNNPIHDPKTVNNIKYNTVIQSSSEIISITNYIYDSADREELIIGESNNVINLYYNRLKGKVIEKHIYENTNAILYEEEHLLPVGDEYNIPSKTFNNYVLNEDKLPTNATGTVREESQEVIYYYRRIVNVITKVTNEGGTIEGDEEVLEEKDSTPNKIVIKADDNHYIEKVTINGEEIEITDNKEMILENFKAMKEDKIVEVSFGEIIKEVPKTDKNTILPIISLIVLAVGMLIIIIQRKKLKTN